MPDDSQPEAAFDLSPHIGHNFVEGPFNIGKDAKKMVNLLRKLFDTPDHWRRKVDFSVATDIDDSTNHFVCAFCQPNALFFVTPDCLDCLHYDETDTCSSLEIRNICCISNVAQEASTNCSVLQEGLCAYS